MRGPDGAVVGNDLRPSAVKNFLAYTLRRLGSDHVDVYRPGRVFPDLAIEETPDGEIVQIGDWSPASRDQSPDTIVNVAFQTTGDRETAELWRAELSAGRLPQRTENVP